MTKRVTPRQAAARLGVCQQRVSTKLAQGHFPNAAPCECGRTILIPENDIQANLATAGKRKRKING